MIVFGNSPERPPLGDVPRMQAALERYWDADPYALGTWRVFRPGQPGRVLPGLGTPEGRSFFASGDSAVAWRGFIDGAIESGYRSAREIDRYLPS